MPVSRVGAVGHLAPAINVGMGETALRRIGTRSAGFRGGSKRSRILLDALSRCGRPGGAVQYLSGCL
jgi:hypothetical protein